GPSPAGHDNSHFQNNPAAWRAKAMGLVAVRSSAGSFVDQDWTLSLYFAPLLPLNCLKASPPLGGQFFMPLTLPEEVTRFGPSTAAPASIGGEPFREPARFASWDCMQCGNVVPSPTIRE